jgi:hypothetical protein
MELTLERLYDQYETMIKENYSQKDLNWVIDLISEMENGIFEDTGTVGSTGVALANATTAGMGGVVSPQASAFPGALNGTNWISGGGSEGSGDLSVPYNPSGKNRVFQKLPMGKSHGSGTGKKSRNKPINMKSLQNILKKGKEDRPKKVLSFNDFEKSKMDVVTKVREGKAYKASKASDKDIKKEEFRKKVEEHVKSHGAKVKQIGNDFELTLTGDKVAQIMFRDDYIGVKKEGGKFTDKFEYTELGKIKKNLTDLIKNFD